MKEDQARIKQPSQNQPILIIKKKIVNTINNIPNHLKPHTTSNIMNIKQIILTFNNQASIEKFREFLSEISSNDFEFTEVTEDDVKKRF